VEARVTNASTTTVNRCLCYCDDCQAFLHHLDRADLLDAAGGSDIVQVAPASLTFSRGTEHIVGLRLTPKGLYRWYADCCKTPLGNTLTPALPFVGIVTGVFEGGVRGADEAFGKPVGGSFGEFAIGVPPEGSIGVNLRIILRTLRLVATWRLRGRTWPHPFFERATRAPSRPVNILPRAEREALRKLCGPRPAVPGAQTS